MRPGFSAVPAAPHTHLNHGQTFACDDDPERFRVYAFAIVAMHHPRRSTCDSQRQCSCGELWDHCPYGTLASALLFCVLPEENR